MTEIIKTLDEICAENKIVICDSGIEDRRNSNWFHNWMFEAHSYSDLDICRLQEVFEHIGARNIIFSMDPMITVDKTVEELANFRDILIDKKSFLDKRIKYSRNARKGDFEEHNSHYEELIGIFQKISNQMHLNYSLARKRVFVPSNKDGFDKLERLTLAVASQPRVKRDFDQRYNRAPSDSEDIHTDERIVATSFYISMIDEQPNAVITSDSDIGRIAYGVQTQLKKMNCSCQKNLVKFPSKVYFLLEDGTFQQHFDSSEKIGFYRY